MPAKTFSLKKPHLELAKIRKQLKSRKKGATRAHAAALDRQIKHIEQSINSLRNACRPGYNVG